jgi:tetratricopeptide (TPR) repeat protein
LSKLSQLKQKAYKAGKDRNWDLAINVYEQILEVEKNNPTVINELGDLCLKSGDTRQAMKHFLSAATKYRKTGLLNNSVAICKKVLRHEATNVHAHWYLSEIRSSQDLVHEGQSHALAFLVGSANAGGEIQEIFHKRCVKLLELYPGSNSVLEKLVQIFRGAGMTLEASRAGCLHACTIFDAGDEDGARKMAEDHLVTSPELRNYPEFGKWNKRINPNAVEVPSSADYNSVNLESGGDSTSEVTEAPTSEPTEAPVEVPAKKEISFGDIGPLDSKPSVTIEAPEVDTASVDEKDDEGCLVIDTPESSDMADLIAQAAQELENVPSADEVAVEVEVEVAEEEVVAQEAPESVDLLAQILAEDSEAVLGNESDQVDTIAAEIGNLVGGGEGDDDADRLYEMGMVYLEMGLFDKACESFETAAADDDYTIRAHEMWGMTLQRAERPDEAITVLTAGLQFAEADSRENLGLRYHIGCSHELAGRPEAAVEIYEEIQAIAPNFLDISSRLGKLSTV